MLVFHDKQYLKFYIFIHAFQFFIAPANVVFGQEQLEDLKEVRCIIKKPDNFYKSSPDAKAHTSKKSDGHSQREITIAGIQSHKPIVIDAKQKVSFAVSRVDRTVNGHSSHRNGSIQEIEFIRVHRNFTENYAINLKTKELNYSFIIDLSDSTIPLISRGSCEFIYDSPTQ